MYLHNSMKCTIFLKENIIPKGKSDDLKKLSCRKRNVIHVRINVFCLNGDDTYI